MSEIPGILTTHDRTEAWLRRQGVQLKGEETDDMILDVLLGGASVAVQQEIQRNLRPLELDVTKRFLYDGSGFLSLTPNELSPNQAPVIVMGSDLPTSSQRTLAAQSPTAAAEYRLNPRDLDAVGCYDELTLPTMRGTLNAAAYEVSVTGDWGVDEIPGDIEWLVLEIVRLSYPTPSVGPVDEFSAFANLQWLPRQLMEVLDAYRNQTV